MKFLNNDCENMKTEVLNKIKQLDIEILLHKKGI